MGAAKQKQIPQSARDAVEERSGGVCEACGVARASNIHHRKYRSRGGAHDIHNLLAVCGMGNTSGCHGAAHSGGEHSGWSVPSWAREEWWPVLYRGEWVLMLDEPDQAGSWVTWITATTASLLMGRVSKP